MSESNNYPEHMFLNLEFAPVTETTHTEFAKLGLGVRPIEQTTALITGATDGLGRGVAEDLAAQGVDLHLHGRDAEKLRATADSIRGKTGNERITTHLAELSSLDEVRVLAVEVENSTDELHILISNAGIGGGPPDLPTRQESRDGYELRFAVNYLAGFLLTVRLLPLLRRSAPARVVNVASLGQAPIDFDDVMLEHDYDRTRAYCQSKLAQITSANFLAERIHAGEVTFNSLHPASLMPTKIVLGERDSIDSLETGIEAVLKLATSEELDGVSGKFFDRTVESIAQPQAYDTDAQQRLWELSLQLTDESDPFAERAAA
jgi:NAD(P)-dependent dehydrogenase (short-subunit alcohol dehydrogenase family)